MRFNVRSSKRPVLAALAAVAAILTADAVQAQSSNKSSKVIEEKVLSAQDGWPIHITYFQSAGGKDAPAVILLHGDDGNRLVWRKSIGQFRDGLAGRLQDEGYAVVTVDLRQHGESKSAAAAGSSRRGSDLGPDDYARMVRFDLEAVKDFLMEEHQKGNLNIRKTAIVAAGMSAPVAINYAWVDWQKTPYDDAPSPAARTPRGQDIRALALISPTESLPGLPTGRALLDLRSPNRGIAFLVAYGSKDKLDRGDSRKIHQKVSTVPGSKDRVYLQAFDFKLRGTDMLGAGIKLEETILGFLKKHLQDLPDEWRDRQSRIAS